MWWVCVLHHQHKSFYNMICACLVVGSRQTHFGNQATRFADLYASSCLNLGNYPVNYLFTAPHQLVGVYPLYTIIIFNLTDASWECSKLCVRPKGTPIPWPLCQTAGQVITFKNWESGCIQYVNCSDCVNCYSMPWREGCPLLRLILMKLILELIPWESWHKASNEVAERYF